MPRQRPLGSIRHETHCCGPCLVCKVSDARSSPQLGQRGTTERQAEKPQSISQSWVGSPLLFLVRILSFWNVSRVADLFDFFSNSRNNDYVEDNWLCS